MSNNPNAMILSMDPKAEATLIIAAKKGNGQAFETLVVRHKEKISAVALRYTRIPEDAEDVVQQTFQKAFIHLHRFQGKSSFSTWLTRIAINEALMLLRRRRALREVSNRQLDRRGNRRTALLDVPDSSPDPETNYLKREGIEVLSAAISKLTLRLRTAIQLRELAELSTQETARRMGLSVGAVKARVFHGRRKLRNILRRLEITPTSIQRLSVVRLANRSCPRLRSQSH